MSHLIQISRKEFSNKVVFSSLRSSPDLTIERCDLNSYDLIYRYGEGKYYFYHGTSEEVLSLLTFIISHSLSTLKFF